VERLPEDDVDARLDAALARAAVRAAVRRHAGRIETIYTAVGPVTVQYGKDLRGLQAVIGTGGVFAANPEAVRILEAALQDGQDPQALLPERPSLYLDTSYVLYAVGLLASVDRTGAIKVARRSLRRVREADEEVVCLS
jgi:uncharacterized protein (TIGR01319 family)